MSNPLRILPAATSRTGTYHLIPTEYTKKLDKKNVKMFPNYQAEPHSPNIAPSVYGLKYLLTNKTLIGQRPTSLSPKKHELTIKSAFLVKLSISLLIKTDPSSKIERYA